MGGACMLVMGNGIGPPTSVHRKNGQAGVVCRASTLQLALLSSSSRAAPVPRWGGIYAPDVLVFSDGESRHIPRFRMDMVYAISPWAPNTDEDPSLLQFQAEMRKKITNVLRICHLHGHDTLILGAWSCGNGGGPPAFVAKIFRESLMGSADTARTSSTW